MALNQSDLAAPSPTFYSRLAQAKSRVLVLDYDGTLAPFRVERLNATPYPGIRERITRLIEGGQTRIVMISGRSLDDLLTLLTINPLPELWASHGWEHLDHNGKRHNFRLPTTACQGLAKARTRVAKLLPMAAAELKPASVAVHWRGEPRAEAAGRKLITMEAWTPIAADYNLEIHPFDEGLELRVPGRSKGTAIHDIIKHSPKNTLVAYLGDDVTDEDAFRSLPQKALGVLVRDEWRPTAANAWVRPPEGLIDFLDRWIAAVENMP